MFPTLFRVGGFRLATYGVLVAVYAFMQFFGSPVLGSLSDRFGRRKVILIADPGIDNTGKALAVAASVTFIDFDTTDGQQPASQSGFLYATLPVDSPGNIAVSEIGRAHV